MMNRLMRYSCLLLCLSAGLTACDDDGIDVLDIEIPEGYALSAGTSTIFMNSSKAYDSPADWVSGVYNSRFNDGDGLYDDVRTSSNGMGGGLGPVYAGYSCGSCHRNAGRTKPTLWSEGGSGSYGFSSMLVYISRKNGAFFQDYGRVLHDQAIYGVKPEGKLSVEYTYETFTFPDGEKYELCRPVYSISEWYADSIKPEDMFCTVRIPLRHVGMGQMMALEPTEIEALAAKSNYPEYGKREKPVVFYGTSILQGGCASRPGMVHTNILERWLNRECINLGFSGNALLDLEIADVIAGVDASMFVLDFVPNATVEQMRERADKFYTTIRSKHPDTPVLFVEDPLFTHSPFDTRIAKEVKDKNETLNAFFRSLKQRGEKNIYFLASRDIIGHDGEATVDGIHFTDLGFMRYAEILYPILEKHMRP